jgi:hypothetical protein
VTSTWLSTANVSPTDSRSKSGPLLVLTPPPGRYCCRRPSAGMRACVGPCCGAPCPSIQHYTGGSVRWQDRWPMNHTCILLYRDWAHPRHIFTGTGLARSTSAPGLGSRLPHLHRDRVTLCHICTGTVLTPATSASGPGWRSFHFAMLSSGPVPLHRLALHKSATGNGSCRPSPDRSHPGLGSPPAHTLHRDSARTGTI